MDNKQQADDIASFQTTGIQEQCGVFGSCGRLNGHGPMRGLDVLRQADETGQSLMLILNAIVQYSMMKDR